MYSMLGMPWAAGQQFLMVVAKGTLLHAVLPALADAQRQGDVHTETENGDECRSKPPDPALAYVRRKQCSSREQLRSPGSS